MGPDVFISYSSQNKMVADAVCATLESHGVHCWYAPRDILPGSDWTDAIIDAISASRMFVLILSAASNISEQVKREVQNAVSEGKPIIPFRIEEAPLSKHMRYFIGTPHWLDAISPPLENYLFKLNDTVKTLLDSLDRNETVAFSRPPSVTSAEAQQPRPAAPAAIFDEAQQPRPAAPAAIFDSAFLARTERELRVFIGPIAGSVVREATAQTSNHEALWRWVAEEIPAAADRKSFLARYYVLSPVAPVPSPPPPISVASSLSSSRVPPFTPDPQLLQHAEKLLAGYIGPMSRVIVTRASRNAATRDEFLAQLVTHLSPKERDEFLRKFGSN